MSNSIHSLSSTPCPNSTTIDDLPESLVVHILSFLYIQDAIRTSLVSRKFRNLWHSIPDLNFDMTEFYSRSTSPNPRTNVSRQLFAEFVYHTLFLRPHYPLTKFMLTFDFKNNEQHKYYVHNWIRYAIDLSVSQLILVFYHDKFNLWHDVDFDSREFDFHLLDIRESCVKVLKLYLCRLILPPKTNSIKFVSLKSLELDVALVGDNDVCDLLARCVNLETLRLEGMSFHMSGGLRIYSDSLKELYLDSASNDISYSGICLDVNICCPSLQKISLINLDFEKYIIKDTTLLVEACVDCFFPDEKYSESWEKMLSCFTNISSLHVWDELLASNEVPAGCEQFLSNVKLLELYCDYNEDDLVGVATLLKLLPKLEILGLHNRGTNNAKLHQGDLPSSTVFNMPRLRKVILRKYQKTKGEQHFIKLFRKNGIVLEKIKLLT